MRSGRASVPTTCQTHELTSDRSRLMPLLSRAQKLVHLTAALAWVLAVIYFWAWWMDPSHNIGTAWYVINSMVLAWLTAVPLYFLCLYTRARLSRSDIELDPTSRVAMVVTKAPSEPWWVVRETLEAMLAQGVTHDTWLADEDPSPETRAWCATHGVKISCRKGVTDYHRTTWPRRTRCKEGNLAYFYDHYGYDQYDFVVQMDADHVPTPGYLREMLKPFADPRVGYVSAPSICDKNASQSWSARGRLYVESTMHGVMQAAYSNGWAPLCIGSHYAVRTKALKDIGGLGPELAEDHSTTLMMNAHGWRGVHAFNAIAHGDGAATFADLIVQEFQWSRSLVTILLEYSPRYIPRLPMHLRFQFLFCQFWYPLFSGFMLLMYLMPIMALSTGRLFADVTLIDFYLHVIAAHVIILLLAWRWQANGWLRPVNAKIISWEALAFLFAKWPWVLAGTLAALRDRYFRSFVDFRVTPKGDVAAQHLPLWILAPYVGLSLISGLTVIACADAQSASGFYFFAILNCALYAGLVTVIVVRHATENDLNWRVAPVPTSVRHALCCGVLVLPLVGLVLRGPATLEALAWGSDTINLTTTTYSASGAGQRGHRIKHVRFTLLRENGRMQ
jgi:cellulose synthase/poly-beta-1,6-N-acetylglucosamine synthase-like glycosyltransferase